MAKDEIMNNVFVNNVDRMYLLGCSIVHPIQKDTGNVQGVAAFPLRTAI